jgi:hypothetical protein
LTAALDWHLRWGRHAETIAAAAMESGAALDQLPFLAERADPEEHLRLEWAAFWDLTTDRQIGFATGPIPWSAIDRYAARYRIPDFDRFSELIRAMDATYLEHIEEERQKAKEKNGNGHP